MMSSAQVVETSVNVTTKSPSQDYTHPDDRTSLRYEPTHCSKRVEYVVPGVVVYLYLSLMVGLVNGPGY